MALKMPQASPVPSSIPSSENLISVAKELNCATKDLATVFTDIELGLRKLNLGVSAWVPLSSKEDDSSSQMLGYAKHRGRWCLIVRQFELDAAADVVSQQDTLLRDAPREIRVWAAGQLGELFAELTKEAAALAARIKKNLNAADTLAATLAFDHDLQDGNGEKQ
jgi:hypothetical protein